MPLNRLNPSSIAPPVGAYCHAVSVSGAGQWLHLSGQIGNLPDGELPSSFDAQADAAWANIVEILRTAGFSVGDLVRVTTFLVDQKDAAALRTIRSSHLGGATPASTLLIVKALAHPDWLIEIEAIAFRAEPD